MIEFIVSMVNSNLGSILSGHRNTEGVATIFFILWALNGRTSQDFWFFVLLRLVDLSDDLVDLVKISIRI